MPRTFKASKEVIDALVTQLYDRIDAGEGWHVEEETPVREIEPVKDDKGQLWAAYEHTGEHIVRVSRRVKDTVKVHTILAYPAKELIDPVVITKDARSKTKIATIWKALDRLENRDEVR